MSGLGGAAPCRDGRCFCGRHPLYVGWDGMSGNEEGKLDASSVQTVAIPTPNCGEWGYIPPNATITADRCQANAFKRPSPLQKFLTLTTPDEITSCPSPMYPGGNGAPSGQAGREPQPLARLISPHHLSVYHSTRGGLHRLNLLQRYTFL